MLEWDSDDDSLGDMTRVSDALGEAHDEAKHGEDDEIDEMELLQLRNLVQQIKLQTVLGDKFVKLENQGSGSNCLASIVTPVTEEDVEAKYRQLQADHVDVVEERDQLAARINQLTMQGEGQLTMQGEGGQRRQGVDNNTEMIVAKIERERDEARRETQAAKEEVKNLKISQINLKLYYQEKANQLGTGSMKNGSKDCSSVVPLEEYNRLKELHFSLNKQLAESEHNVYTQQDDLHEAIRRAQQAENQLGQIKYEQMWKEQAQANGYSSNNQAGLLGNPVLHQILQMNQQLQHNNYRR